jgi:hypothetical protein
MSRRGAGMDEVVAALRACWGPDPVEFAGRFHRIAASELNPKPVQAHLPILFGSVFPAGIRRAARVADGFNPIATSAGALRAAVADFRAAAAEAGRDPATLTVVARANTVFTREPMGERRPYLGGSPKQIAADLADLDDLTGGGVDAVLLSSVGRADHDIDVEIRLMADIRDAAMTVSWA